MTVKAFVGHSFLPKDQDLVRVFTDYLDALRKTLPDFDWVHAKEPRPDGVPLKVLDMIKGRNLFIGICTRNERVSKGENFKTNIFGNKLNVAKADLTWKTSDWIIQEIGLAIGRDMKIILLLESGIRKPGGLFGDLEYIQFDRDNPTQAFQSLTEMISNVSVAMSDQSASSVGEISSGDASKTEEANVKNIERKEPTDDWSEHDYSFEYFLGLLRGDEIRCENIDKAYLATVGGATTPAGAAWQAQTLFNRIRWGKGGKLKEMQALADRYPSNPDVLECTAKAYLHYKDRSNARGIFLKAADLPVEAIKKINLLCNAAGLFEGNGEPDELSEIADLITTVDLEKGALDGLSDLENYYDEEVYKLAMLERRVQIDPSDTQLRFNLAYSHSQEKNYELALYHYLQIPENERDAVTWNNLGVSFRQFSMPTNSTNAYKKSVEAGETLAMSNLAHIYMSAGFFNEAKEVLGRAQSIDGCHENVATAQVALNSIYKNEEEEKSKAISKAPDESAFYANMGHALLISPSRGVASRWKCEHFELEAKITNNEFFACGIQVVESSNLVNALVGTQERDTQSSYKILYKGKIRGRTITGIRTKTKMGRLVKSSLLGSFDDTGSFIIIIAEDGLSARSKEKHGEIDFKLVN